MTEEWDDEPEFVVGPPVPTVWVDLDVATEWPLLYAPNGDVLLWTKPPAVGFARWLDERA